MRCAAAFRVATRFISNEKISGFQQEPSELRLRAARQPLMSRRQNHKWSAEHDARLRELHAEGRSWGEIGAAIGVTAASAKAHGRCMSLKLRPLCRECLPQSPEAAAGPVLPPQPSEPAAPAPVPSQSPPGAATGRVAPHLKILANSTLPQRSEGGHPLPAGHPLTWSLLMSLTPVLGNPTWPKGENA
jgi:hypothetical protein